MPYADHDRSVLSVSPVLQRFLKAPAASSKWANAISPFFCSAGHFYAIEDDCPHAGAPLNDGTVHRGIVACLRHGWRFDLRDGRCVNFPAAPVVATFPVTIQGEDIYITLPDAAPPGS